MSRGSSSSDNSDFGERRRYHQIRLKCVFANERKHQEIDALEKMVDEMKSLIIRTQDYLRDSREKLNLRESMLKLTLPISDINFAKRILKQMPNLPQRYHPRPKVLDDALISFLLLGGYVQPDFSEDEQDNMRALPEAIDVENQIFEELAAAAIPVIPDFPDSPEPEFISEPLPEPGPVNPIVRRDHEPEEGTWVDKLIIDEMDEN